MQKKDCKQENRFLKAKLFLEKEKTKHLQKELENALASFQRINNELVGVYKSKRWKITAPLAKIRGLRGGPAMSLKTEVNEEQLPDFDDTVFHNGKKTIFVIDQYVPNYDKDAGSRCTYGYIQMFLDMGYNVIFMGNDFDAPQPYTQKMQDKGVVVLAGTFYAKHWQEWVKRYGKYIDVLLLNRPHVAQHFLGTWRQESDAKIVYMGHDLHFLRQKREYEISGNSETFDASNVFKAMEFVVMYESDVVMMFNEDEKRIIKEEFGIDAMTIPLYYFKDLQKPEREIEKTRDLIFVGGFLHQPNVDAVKWFVEEIWPTVKKHLPGIKFYIVGSNPPQEIKNLASNDIIVTGFVTDEQLENYYHSCRICVLPLRFGAGVKGKTLEAMKTGIPIVSTSIGIEGMQAVETVISPYDQAGEFAQQIIEIYQDDKMISECPEKYTEYLRKYFSYEKTKEIFRHVFES